MGTRSITRVLRQYSKEEECEQLVAIYRHWDGYPSQHGKDILEFLKETKICNGKVDGYVSGPEGLAAKLVVDLYNDGHGPSLVGAETDWGQEYEYHIKVSGVDNFEVYVEVYDGPVAFFGEGGDECDNLIFSGTVAEYETWIGEQL